MWAAAAALAAFAGTAGAADAAGACTRAYWSGAVPTADGADKPASLRSGAAGRTAEGALVAVHVDAANANRPTASFFNEHQSSWTSHQAFPSVQCEGAAVGATAAPALGDGAGGDVFALFGGQATSGQYSDKVLGYAPSSGWTTLSPEPAPNREASPRGRAGATLTGVGSAQDGTSRYLLLGGVDDEGDFADTWLLTTRGGDATYSWKQLQLASSDAAGFTARSGHSAAVWKPALDAAKGDRTRVVVFGGCQQQGDGGPACRNDVWIVTVPTKSSASFSMVQVKISEDSAADAPLPVQGASILILKDTLYVYGGCSLATATVAKACSTQLRAIDLSAYAASEATLSQPNSGVAAASWTHPQTGTQNHGLAMSGALAVLTQTDGADAGDVASTMMLLGGCIVDKETGRSVCKANRQNVNLAGVCANDCQHGATVSPMGTCECTKDFTGTFCADAVSSGNVDCPKDCAGHGTCTGGKCQCEATYGGADCTQRVCSVEGPEDCSGHGMCTTVPNTDTPLCVCKGQYHGVVCSERFCSPRDCNGHGACNTKLGKCDCEPGFGGAGCEKAHLCAGNCTNHGACVVTRATVGAESSSHCECEHGWSGKACAHDDRCDLDFGGCGEHGHCLDNKCACDEGYIGKQCKDRKCPKQCSGHGECDVESGTCKCMFGFVGDDCAKGLKCPNDCSGLEHGICVPNT